MPITAIWITFIAFVGADKEKAFEFPRFDEIKTVEAEVYQYPGLLGQTLPRVRSFTVPRSGYPKVLGFFQNAVVDRSPTKDRTEIGSVLIETKKGTTFRIPFYRTHQGMPLEFSVGGRQLEDGIEDRTGDMGIVLEWHIRGIYEELTGHVVTRRSDGSSQRSCACRYCRENKRRENVK